MIVSGTAASFVWWLYKILRKCWDRGCTNDYKRTKKLTQEEYEDINKGGNISFEEKYSETLCVVFLTMMYGPGIPIMYVIAAIYFFVTFWVDKLMILYQHRKPLFYDEQLALQVNWWFKIGIILHLIVGILMFSNSHILPVGTSFTDGTQGEDIGSQAESVYSFGNITSIHMGFFMGVILFIILCYIIYRLFVTQILALCRAAAQKLRKVSSHEDEMVHSNIYDVVNF